MLLTTWKLNNIWMKAIRTPLLKADDTPYEIYADNPHGEDLLQTLYPVTHAEHIVYRDRALYRYRRHSRSITRRLDFDRIDKIFDGKILGQLRRYMTIWGMDTPDYVGRFQARRVGGLLGFFWQHYRIAKTSEQRRELLEYDWAGHADRIGSGLDKARFLSRSQRLQLWAIRNRKRCLLNLIGLVGTIKMRSAYEQ
jgi:hypothetical protein